MTVGVVHRQTPVQVRLALSCPLAVARRYHSDVRRAALPCGRGCPAVIQVHTVFEAAAWRNKVDGLQQGGPYAERLSAVAQGSIPSNTTPEPGPIAPMV